MAFEVGLEAALTSFLLAAAAVGRYFVKRHRSKAHEHAIPRAASIQAQHMHATLREVAGNLGCQRAVLLKAHNGGGLANPGSALKLSVVEHWHPSEYGSISGEYVGRPLSDRDYRLMIGELDKREIMLVHTENLSERSMLRDELERDDLRSAWVCCVRREANPSYFYFIMVSSRAPLEHDAKSRALLRATASKLNALLADDLMTTLDSS